MKKIIISAVLSVLLVMILASCQNTPIQIITPPSTSWTTSTPVWGQITSEPSTIPDTENVTTDSADETKTPPYVEKTRVEKITTDKSSVSVYVGENFTPQVTVHPSDAENKEFYMESSNAAVAIIRDGQIVSRGEGECIVKVISREDEEVFAEIKVEVIHTPADRITYIDGLLIANKTYALPSDYDPGVDPEAKAALDKMIAAAKLDGLRLWNQSGYRTYDYQKYLYDKYVAKDGKEKADTYSARPGHSEHQSGLAFDINQVTDSFAGTPEAIWLAEHCHEFGFIIRYPKGKEHITGYKYEPWHIRYVGDPELAKAITDSGLCLEEYLGITSAYRD